MCVYNLTLCEHYWHNWQNGFTLHTSHFTCSALTSLFKEKKQKNASGDEHLVAAAPTYRLSYVILLVLRTEPSDGELHPGTGVPTDVSLEGSLILGNLQTSLWRAPWYWGTYRRLSGGAKGRRRTRLHHHPGRASKPHRKVVPVTSSVQIGTMTSPVQFDDR